MNHLVLIWSVKARPVIRAMMTINYGHDWMHTEGCWLSTDHKGNMVEVGVLPMQSICIQSQSFSTISGGWSPSCMWTSLPFVGRELLKTISFPQGSFLGTKIRQNRHNIINNFREKIPFIALCTWIPLSKWGIILSKPYHHGQKMGGGDWRTILSGPNIHLLAKMCNKHILCEPQNGPPPRKPSWITEPINIANN